MILMKDNREWIQPHNPPYYWFEELLRLFPNVSIWFLMGGRGFGKSLGVGKLNPIYDFLNFGKETVYLRRFKSELKETKKDFLLDILDGDPRLAKFDIKIVGDNMMIDGKKCISFIPMSQMLKFKSIVKKNVKNVIFDEILTLDKTLDDLGYDEVTMVREFLDTVFRDRDDVNIFFLSNAVSSTSSYLDMLGFDNTVNPNKRFNHPPHTKDILLEINKDKNYIKHKQETRLYQLLPKSKHNKYAIENEFIYETNDNILSKSRVKGHTRDFITLCINEDKYIDIVIFDKISLHLREIDISEIKDVNKVYTFKKDYAIYGYHYITSTSMISEQIQSAITTKRIYFENQKVKKMLLNVMKSIIKTYF